MTSLFSSSPHTPTEPKKRAMVVKGTAEEKTKEKKKRGAPWIFGRRHGSRWRKDAREKKKRAPRAPALRKNCMSLLEKERVTFFLNDEAFCRGRKKKKARAIHHTNHTHVWLMQASQTHAGFRRLASLAAMLMCASVACTVVGGQLMPHSDVTRARDDAHAVGVSTTVGYEVPYDDGPDGRSRGVFLFDLSPLDPTDGPCESIVDDEACYRRCGCEWCGPGRGHGCHSIPSASTANATGPCADGKSGRRDAFWSCHREAVAWIAGGIVGAMTVAFFVGVALCWCHRKKVAARCCAGCCGVGDRSRRHACINNDDGAGGDVWLGGYVSMPRYVNP